MTVLSNARQSFRRQALLPREERLSHGMDQHSSTPTRRFPRKVPPAGIVWRGRDHARDRVQATSAESLGPPNQTSVSLRSTSKFLATLQARPLKASDRQASSLLPSKPDPVKPRISKQVACRPASFVPARKVPCQRSISMIGTSLDR